MHDGRNRRAGGVSLRICVHSQAPAGERSVTKHRFASPAQRLFLVAAILVAAVPSFAQDPAPAAPPAAPKEDLSQSQLQLLRDFERFEKSLYDVAEYSRRTDPEQSELLYRARSQSQEQRILEEMRLLSDSLKPQSGGKVVIGDSPEKQAEVIARLQTLLKVLQSADERDRLQREIERIQDLLKGTNALIGKQRDVRSDTGRGGDQKQLSERERKLIEEAEKLAQKIDRQDAERRGESPGSKSGEKKDDGKEGDSKPGEPKPGEKPEDGKPSDQKPGGEEKPGEKGAEKDESRTDPKAPMKSGDGKDSKPGEKSDDKPMEGTPGPDQKQGDQKPGDQKPEEKKPTEEKKSTDQKPMEGQPPQEGRSQDQPSKSQDGKPPEPGQPQQGQKPQKGQQPQELGEQKPGQQQSPQQQGEQPPEEGDQKTPGREELEQAREQMQRALEELDKQNRDGSSEAQQRALAELEKVKARLEAILRQLREEEDELLLASLEARFQKLRKAQMQVNVETVRLAKTAAEDRSRHDDRAVALSRDENEIVVDAEKALSLLKEEGSSVAFPEAIEQMRDNMVAVGRRLNSGDTGSTTQVIEELIVETLDEMILAMQQEMEKKKDKDRQNQQQQQQQQQDDEQALINELAELKMIRSLQNQINRLTREIGRELEGEQASDPDLRKMTEDLSRRQKRLQQATYDMATGKNK